MTMLSHSQEIIEVFNVNKFGNPAFSTFTFEVITNNKKN